MESHFNTFAASTGLLGNIIQGCLAVSTFLGRVENADELAKEFTARLEFCLSRLDWWSCIWKIVHDESPSTGVMDARLQIYGNAIANYLELIRYNVHHLTSHQNNIPIFKTTISAQAYSATERFAKLLNTPWKEYSEPSSMTTQGSPSGLAERLKWASRNGPAMERLTLLNDLIRDLFEFFPPPGPRSDMSGAVLVNPTLMTEQGNWKLRWLSRQTEMNPFAASLAWLKATTISHINDLKLSPDYNIQRLYGLLIPSPHSATARHYSGDYNGLPVLVEKKTVPRSANNDILKPRIEKVVHLLKASQKIQELRTLPCIGYIYTQPGEGSLKIDANYCKYEFLYTVNAGPAMSLRDMLHRKKADNDTGTCGRRNLSLDKRFEIARTLSRALLYLHAAEWLHKGIRSSNVMFVPSNQPTSESNKTILSRFGLPYLVGFEYSRVASNDEGTENQATNYEDNLYRHPESQGLAADNESYIGKMGRFTKDHDIYSLGVTLAEMGVLKSAKTITKEWKKEYGHPPDVQDFRKFLIEKLIPHDITLNMGATYARVALRCLKPDFYSLSGRSNRDGSIAFYKEIVSQLELCRA